MLLRNISVTATLAIWVLFGGTTVSSVLAEGSEPRRPDILLIVSEDNGPHLGCYGDRTVETPNLDRLAAEGVRFENAYVTQAGCSPSRSSILTGLYPHQNGQIGLASHRYSMYRKYDNIPSLLKKEGYRTGIIGKLHVNPGSAFPFDFRWNDSKFCSFSNRDMRKIAEVAKGFITASQQPFFLMVNYPDAHFPLLPQQNGIPATPLKGDDIHILPFIGIDTPRIRKAVANYYNCLSRLDTGIGMLLQELANAGRAENTLVIYLGDHGSQFPRGKMTCYESGLRIPLIVRWPGRARSGLVKSELVSTVDILPTILQAVGAEVPAGLVGRSIRSLLKGKEVPWREYVFGQYHAQNERTYFPQRSVRDRRYKLIVNLLQDRQNSIAQHCVSPDENRWSIVRVSEIAAAGGKGHRAYETWLSAPPEELYDLEKDPYEFNNLADKPQYAAIQQRLQTQLKVWQKQTNDPLTDPKKLAQLTMEHDDLREGFGRDNKGKRRRVRPADTTGYRWKYHTYFWEK